MDHALESAARRTRGVTLSVMIHACVLGWILAVSTRVVQVRPSSTAPAGAMRWTQLEGDGPSRPGRNGLFDILGADDVVRVVLRSPSGADAPKGLIWWSPSRGLWFAIDDAPPQLQSRRLRLSIQPRGGAAMTVGVVRIDDDRSGRLLSEGDSTSIGVPAKFVVTDAARPLRVDAAVLSADVEAHPGRRAGR